MKRPVILVDLDHVLYPFTDVMANLVSQTIRPDYHPGQLIELYKTWEMWDDWGVPKGQFDLLWERGIKSGQIYGLADGSPVARPIRGSVQGMWQLSDAEWHIHIVTARLNKFRHHDKTVENTVDWLRGWGIPYRSLSFTSDKHAIAAEAIVDDQPNHLIDHPAPDRFLFPAAHNVDKREGEYVTLEEHHPWQDLVERLI